MPDIKTAYHRIQKTILAWCVIALLIWISPVEKYVGIFLYAIVIFSSVFIIQQTIKIILNLPEKLPWIPFMSGIILMLGGVVSDVGLVIIQALDWDRDIYTIDKLLLDLGFKLSQICYMCFFSHIIIFIMTALLWMAFLKSYPSLIRQIAVLNCWQVLRLPVNSFFFVSTITPLLIAFFLYRFYLGLTCFEILPMAHEWVTGWIFLGSLISYLGITYHKVVIAKILTRLVEPSP